MKKYLYIFVAGLVSLLTLLFMSFKAGGDKIKVKILNKTVKKNEKTQRIKNSNVGISRDKYLKWLQSKGNKHTGL